MASVLVRGFDFGTSEEKIGDHMSSVGTVESVQFLDQGSACVTYSSIEDAKEAVAQLQQTCIDGNRRYLDVLLLDPSDFLAGHNIDEEKTRQFFAMSPEQQQAVMSRGTLSTARDPTAVLVQRMKQARGNASAMAPGSAGMKRISFGGNSVLVRGFDFGTSEEQIGDHMSSVGAIESVQSVDDGSVCVTYSSAEEAKEAVAQLQQTCIEGNRRYIDVLSMDPSAFLAGQNVDEEKAKQFMAMSPEQQKVVMARGTLSTARDPTAVLVQRMKQALGNASAMAFGSPGVKGSSPGGRNPVSIRGGKNSVLVRGFDFGTTEEQIGAHMSSVGTIESVERVDEGSVCVSYSSAEEAREAAALLQQTSIDGNTRYIDVLPMDPQEFLAGHNIDTSRAEQFFAMTPGQQQAIMARGTLSTARDPTAVLVNRMKQVQGNASPMPVKGNSPGGRSPMPASMGAGYGGSYGVMGAGYGGSYGVMGAGCGGSYGVMGTGLGGRSSVLVRGFDFGTTEEQIGDHMSSVGRVENVQFVDQGSACVTYSYAVGAKAAVAQLQQTSIVGNTRYLDVLPMDPREFLAGHNINEEKANQFFCMSPVQQQAVMARGTLATARDPTAVLVQRMKDAAMGKDRGGGGGKGSYGPAKGCGGGMTGGRGNAPYGGATATAFPSNGGRGSRRGGQTSSVLVRGFDFGTTDEQIGDHMSNVGRVESVQFVDDGSVCVTYSSAAEANAAVAELQQTSIAGNRRYIDVLSLDPRQFVAEHNIDMDRAEQFLALSPEQQHAVIGKGTLSTARDPTAVLAQRMKQVLGGGGKGSYGPAKGRGGGMAGGRGNEPYGGGGMRGQMAYGRR